MLTYDPQGNPIELPDNEAWAAYQAGKVGFAADQAVPMRDKFGELVQVQGADLQGALAAGFAPASEAEWQQADREAVYGGAGQTAVTALEGGASGLTFGGFDAAAAAIGGKAYQEAAQARREINPYARLGGEIAGSLAPLLLTEGASAGVSSASMGRAGVAGAREASLLARTGRGALNLASAPVRGVDALGAMAERGVAGLVGAAPESAGMLARATRAAAPMAARGAVEGAIQGGGQAITEHSIGNPNANAEDLVLSGALLGALTGGVLGAGGGLLSRTGKAALRDLGRVDQGAYRTAAEGAETVAQEAGGGWRGWLKNFAEEKAIRSPNPTQKQIGDLEKMGKAFPEARARVPEMMLNELPGEVGKNSLAGMSRREILEAAEAVNQKAGSKIGDVLRKLDAPEFIEHQPDVIGIVQRAREEIVDPLKRGAFSKADAAKLEGYVDNLLESNTGEGFRDLQQARVRLDADIKYHKDNSSPFEKELKKFRNLIEDEIESKADEAAATIGGEFGTTYKAAKADYAASKWIQSAAERGVKAEGANRSISLGDHMFGIAGGALGGSLGPLVGLASAAASGAVSNAIRSRGDQVAAAVASRIAGNQRSMLVLSEAVHSSESQLVRGVRGILTASPERVKNAAPSAAVRVFGATRSERENGYEKQRDAITAAAQDPSRAAAAVAPLRAAAPETAARAEALLNRQAQYLASKLPEKPSRTIGRTPKPSDADLAKFARVVEGVTAPQRVLEDLQRGSINREGLEAIREFYPNRYAQVQQTVMAHVEEQTARGKPIPYEARIKISALLGIPADASYSPEFVATMQASYQTPGGAAPGGAAPTVRAGAKLQTDRYTSNADSLEEGLGA